MILCCIAGEKCFKMTALPQDFGPCIKMYFSTINLFLIELLTGKKAVKCSLSVFLWHMGPQWGEVGVSGQNTLDS